MDYRGALTPVDDAQPVEEAGPDDLLPEIVGPFLRRLRIERPYAYRELNDRELLLATRVLVPGPAGPVPSLAGLLCFGRLPQHLFPQLEITFVEYPTVEGADLATGTRFLDNRAFDRPIPLLVRETLVQLARTARRRTVVSADGGASTVYEYPSEALREAVVNAIVHRDLGPYSLGTQVQVEVLPRSDYRTQPRRPVRRRPPGTLGELGLSSSRNALLLKLLEDVEIPGEGRTVCENRASGIRTMVRAMKAVGLPPPRFADHVSWFEVTLIGPQPALPGAAPPDGREPPAHRALDPNERARLVLGALGRQPLSRREIEAATGLSLYHVRAALSDLINQGVVTATGPARSPSRRYSMTARPGSEQR